MRRQAVIAGGGSGRNIFPGLAVLEQLELLGVDVHWLGARGGLEKGLVGKSGAELTLLDLDSEIGRGLSATLRVLGQLPRALAATVRLFLELRPLAVLGVGGSASAVGLLAAGLLGLPSILQEQNAVPDRISRFLAPFTDLVCCGFAEAVAAFGPGAEWTGNPVHPSFFAVPAVEPSTPPRVLVLGGSRGSMFLNRVLPRALADLADDGIPTRIQHQAGMRWTEVVRTGYRDLRLEAEVTSFMAEPWQAMAEADLVIARSGALTVAELSAAGRGALLIPLSGSLDNRQEHNARSRERANAAVVLTEAEATPARVASTLRELLSDPDRVVAMGHAASASALPEAARRIARGVLTAGGAA